jgi:hypothetical protein
MSAGMNRKIIYAGLVVLALIVAAMFAGAVVRTNREAEEKARGACTVAIRATERAIAERDGLSAVRSLGSARDSCGPEHKAALDALQVKVDAMQAESVRTAAALGKERAEVVARFDGEWKAYDAGPQTKEALRQSFQAARLYMFGMSAPIEDGVIKLNGGEYRKRALALGLTGNSVEDGMR